VYRDSGGPVSEEERAFFAASLADDLYLVFIDLATEPLKMRVHEQFPAASTIQPVYVEPVTIDMKSHLVTVGDPGV
jgi:hypothetical protein